MNRPLALFASIYFAGCGVQLSVVRHPPAFDAITVEPIAFKTPTNEVNAYQKQAEVIEALRDAGALVIDGDAGLPRPARVGVLSTTVEEVNLDFDVSTSPTLGPLALGSFVRYRVLVYVVELRLRDAAGRVVAHTRFEADGGDRGKRLNLDDPLPALTQALRRSALAVAYAVPHERPALPVGLAYLDTHHRLVERIAPWGGATDPDARSLRYFFPSLPRGWRESTDHDGVLVTRVPASWIDVMVGDLIVGVDGHAVVSAAACDRLLSSGAAHQLDLIRAGEPFHVAVGPAPAPAATLALSR